MPICGLHLQRMPLACWKLNELTLFHGYRPLKRPSMEWVSIPHSKFAPYVYAALQSTVVAALTLLLLLLCLCACTCLVSQILHSAYSGFMASRIESYMQAGVLVM